jgi:glycosyltransferase involved in cell wall biosynthesis
MKARRYVVCHGMKVGEGVYLQYSHKYVRRFMPMISEEEYDLVISFLTPHYFGAEKVRAKKRVAWIHTDYSRLEVDAISERQMWDAYDKIVSISDSVGAAFVETFGGLEDKLLRVDNIISPDAVRASAEAESVRVGNEGETVLLSCGRVTEGKNFANIPRMCASLLKNGHNVKWFIVGDGPDTGNVRESIEREGMTDRVILLGARANPYPYMAACDLYVQPSLYEGRSVAVIEAQILGRPVAITDFPTAKGQLRDGFDGVIVPLDDEGCAEGLVRLLKDGAMLEALQKGCESSDYGCEKDIERICSYMEQTALTE